MYPGLNAMCKSIQIFRLKRTKKNKYKIITNPFSVECINLVGQPAERRGINTFLFQN